MTVGAIVLAGGRASRVDGAAKPLFETGGRTLLQRAVDALQDAAADPLTIVGPPGIGTVLEDPPFGGPVAGIVTALRSWTVDPKWTFVLAGDLARADHAVTALLDAHRLSASADDGICLADASSRPQWLTAMYRTAALRDAASRLPDEGRDQSVRALVADLALAVVAAPDATDDIDTWEDLERAKERFDG